jgi:cyclophilin family peptidyl-prolyl cis-trans isomerase
LRLLIGAFGTSFNLDLYGADNRAIGTFSSLVLNRSYVGRRFFRIEPGFIAQAGCPNDSGTGSLVPLFSLNAKDVESSIMAHITATGSGIAYSRGTVALACKEPYKEYGSQFFVCLADLPDLPRVYPVVGRLTGDLVGLSRVGASPLRGEQPTDSTISSVERLDVAV